jgi:hypothetical protein
MQTDITRKELTELLKLVAAKADSDAETRSYWNEIYWKLVAIKTEEEK